MAVMKGSLTRGNLSQGLDQITRYRTTAQPGQSAEPHRQCHECRATVHDIRHPDKTTSSPAGNPGPAGSINRSLTTITRAGADSLCGDGQITGF
jgi:hypothetical protein